MLLTENEIHQLSGYKSSKCQIRWLRENGINYLVGIDGRPRVLEEHIKEIMGCHTAQTHRPKTKPNKNALLAYMTR